MPRATPRFLLEGAHYALIQCGRLLTSAARLYETGDHATAVGLAALAHEELERFRILKAKRRALVHGQTLSVEDVRAACQAHVEKQKRGLVSVMLHWLRDSGSGKLMERRRAAAPRSREDQEVDRQIEDMTERQRGRLADERHQQRMKAFYIEPNETGHGWHQPWLQDREDAQRFIQGAITDYALQANNWHLDFLKREEPELAAAIEDWTTRPVLPPVPRL